MDGDGALDDEVLGTDTYYDVKSAAEVPGRTDATALAPRDHGLVATKVRRRRFGLKCEIRDFRDLEDGDNVGMVKNYPIPLRVS